MPKKTTKSASLDLLLKTIVKTLDLPSRKDIERLMDHMNQIEKLLQKSVYSGSRTGKAPLNKISSRKKGPSLKSASGTASAAVLKVIAESPSGADFQEILNQTGFKEKKIRNIIFRLNKTNKITRKERGTYIAIG